jgi:hypothetical protein
VRQGVSWASVVAIIDQADAHLFDAKVNAMLIDEIWAAA